VDCKNFFNSALLFILKAYPVKYYSRSLFSTIALSPKVILADKNIEIMSFMRFIAYDV
jgi:hypothetical protein